MKEDGIFVLSFFIQRTRLEEIHTYLRMYFEIQAEDDITENVLHSLRLDTQRLSRFADSHFGFRKFTYTISIAIVSSWLFKQFWGLEGSFFFGLLANKTFIYKSFVLKKRNLIAGS